MGGAGPPSVPGHREGSTASLVGGRQLGCLRCPVWCHQGADGGGWLGQGGGCLAEGGDGEGHLGSRMAGPGLEVAVVASWMALGGQAWGRSSVWGLGHTGTFEEEPRGLTRQACRVGSPQRGLRWGGACPAPRVLGPRPHAAHGSWPCCPLLAGVQLPRASASASHRPGASVCRDATPVALGCGRPWAPGAHPAGASGGAWGRTWGRVRPACLMEL